MICVYTNHLSMQLKIFNCITRKCKAHKVFPAFDKQHVWEFKQRFIVISPEILLLLHVTEWLRTLFFLLVDLLPCVFLILFVLMLFVCIVHTGVLYILHGTGVCVFCVHNVGTPSGLDQQQTV